MSAKSKKEVGVIVRKSGVQFRVWAPFADAVSVSGTFNDWGETPLENEKYGYWWGIFKEAEVCHEYKFVIKNGDKIYKRNDPRGVQFTTSAGNSVIASPSFDWGDAEFIAPPIEEQNLFMNSTSAVF